MIITGAGPATAVAFVVGRRAVMVPTGGASVAATMVIAAVTSGTVISPAASLRAIGCIQLVLLSLFVVVPMFAA